MKRKERVQLALEGKEPDRLPVLGGWIANPSHICTLAGVSEDEYWERPQEVSLEAHDRLGSDGLIGAFVPRRNDGYRCVDAATFVQERSRMSLEEAVEKRTREGDPLLIFGPLAVTTELPVCSPDEIAVKVRRAFDVARGRASLLLFTGNTITPDVPLDNIRAMHEAAAACQY